MLSRASFLGRYRLAVVAVVTAIPFIFYFGWPTVAHASGVDDETQFVFNHVLVPGVGRPRDVDVRRFHDARSPGAVRTKNASMICLKNIGLYSIAGLAYFFIGYNLMYVDVGDVIGHVQVPLRAFNQRDSACHGGGGRHRSRRGQ